MIAPGLALAAIFIGALVSLCLIARFLGVR